MVYRVGQTRTGGLGGLEGQGEKLLGGLSFRPKGAYGSKKGKISWLVESPLV